MKTLTTPSSEDVSAADEPLARLQQLIADSAVGAQRARHLADRVYDRLVGRQSSDDQGVEDGWRRAA